MGRKNKAYRLSLHQQIYNRLTSMQAFGESKQQGKADGTMQNKIYSYSTYQSYSRACQSFGKYINKNHTEATTLKSAQKYVNEYLQSLVDSGKSAWTVSLYCSALVKLYQIAPDDPHRFQVPSRHRYDITRSRGTTVSDAHFSAKNHAELIAFCKGVGCRKKAGINGFMGQGQNGKSCRKTIYKGYTISGRSKAFTLFKKCIEHFF